jgi:hypothetical protein
MATVPLSGTNIRLLSGIPFSNDYKHTRWFDNVNEQTSWFLNQNVTYSMTQYNYQRIEGYGMIKVDKSIDDLWGTNYVMFQNASYNNKWFYGFVTKLEYIQRNCTYVYFQIDVLQTWMFNMNFKPSYVVREHCPLWNVDGTPIINTIDEGLNYGTEYDIVSVDNIRPYSDIFFLVMVAKSAMHDSNNIDPTLNGVPQPLSYYVHPFKLDGTLPNIMVGATGLNATGIIDVLKALMTQTKSVTDIVSLYVTEYIGFNASYDGSIITFDSTHFTAVTVGTVNTIYVNSLPQYSPINKTLSNKYSGYTSQTESKLMMHPYTVLTLDDFKGNRVDIKNEYINGNDISVSIKGSIGTSNKVTYTLDNYLQDSNGVYSTITGLEHGVINNSPNDIPILNDMLSAFLQGNRNSIANQKASINFNGIMSIMHSFVSAGNAVAGGIASGNSASAVMGATQNVLGGIQGAGNSVLQLQAINAKQKDIANVPPSLSSMGSNSNFDYGNFVYGLFVIKKQIKPEYQKKLSDFFNMYGYKKNEVKVPNFHTRQNWNYVQTQSCTITGNFNNDDLQEIKNVFDNGITLWHTDDIGNYSLGNGVI